MKFFTNKESSKKIIIALILVMTFNFILPTTSQADFGGELFKPIAQFLRTVGDLVIEGLQLYFMGDGDITVENELLEKGESYYIEYSPGIIFSNKVAGLDVNFFNPGDSYQETEEVSSVEEIDKKEVKSDSYSYQLTDTQQQKFDKNVEKAKDELLSGKGYNSSNVTEYSDFRKFDDIPSDSIAFLKAWTWEYNGETYYYAEINITEQNGGNNVWYKKIIEMVLYKETKDTVIKGNKIESSAKQLQDVVATWYKALRAIALVGLLSVLVYVGIRILISSTGQEKAKYKKMIIDWVTAICILFVLQYIMVFTLAITDKISEVLSASVVGPEGQDVLMSDLRQEVGESNDFSENFAQLLMYLVLVIYTVMFTVQYLKRLLYMAFFTLISPLIALTYPLDKIKDGQAQAFTTWIREYIFNSLLQPMHLLLYCIFVTSASSLVKENPVYAIVAIGFLLPAEKFFRKMFGFEKAASANPIGAAAGGALIMNAINKMGHSGGKKSAGGSKGAGTSTPRYVAAPDSSGSSEGTESTGGGSILRGSTSDAEGSPGGDARGENASTGGRYGQTSSSPRYNVRNSLKGAKTLGGRYGVKALKGLGRLGVGAAGAATLGTVGMAAGIATGDFSNAFKYGAAGVGAGYMGANGLVDKAGNVARGVGEEVRGARDAFEESALGTDEHNTRSSIRELEKDDKFNRVCDNLKITNKGDLIREFHNQGIKSTADIKKSVDIMAKTGVSQNEIVRAHQISQQAKKYGMKPEDIKNSLKSKGYDDKIINKTVDLVDRLM